MEEYSYTQEELDAMQSSAPAPVTGDFPFTKTLVAGATGRRPTTDKVEYQSLLKQGYQDALPKLNQLDIDVADQAAAQGNQQVVMSSLEAINQRIADVESQSNTSLGTLRELSTMFIDNVATSNVGVVTNNTAEEVASQSKLGGSAVFLSQLEQAEATVNEQTTGVMNNTVGIAGQILPTASFAGFHLGSVAEKVLGDKAIGFFEGESKIKEKLRYHYQTLPASEKAEFIKSTYEHLHNGISVNKWLAAAYIQDIIGSGDGVIPGEVVDVLNAVGIAGTLFNVGGIMRGGRLVANGAMLRKNASVLAARVGAKPAEVAAVGNAMMKKGVTLVGGNATGASDVVDFYKMVSGGVAKVLPESVTTASSELQAIIKQKTQEAVDNIRGTVKAGNVRPEEGQRALDELFAKYNPNTNPSVHSMDVNAAGAGRIFFKPADEGSSSFLTKEAAQQWIENTDPTGALGMRVVPDTTNAGYLADMEALKALELERNAVEAKLLEALAKSPVEAPVEPFTGLPLKAPAGAPPSPVSVAPSPIPAPRSLETSKPRYAKHTLTFENNVDKAAYQLASKTKESKSDPEIMEWLQKETGWTPEAILEHGKEVRRYVKALPKESINLSVSSIYKKTPSAAPKPIARTLTEEIEQDLFRLGESIFLSKGVADIPEAQEFLSKILKALDLDGKGRLTVVNAGDTLPPALAAEIKSIDKKVSSANGWHTYYGVDGTTIIKINRNPKNIDQYMSTLAHEVGHNFMARWLSKFGGPVEDAFKAFKKSAKIRGMATADAETWFKHMSAGRMANMIEQVYKGRLSADAGQVKWANRFEEWFCEQFSKWALSDKVPTSLFEKSMDKLVKAIKEIFATVQETLKIRLGITADVSADKTIAKMLNDHVEQMRGGKMRPVPVVPDEVKELQATVDKLTEQINAMQSAKDGLKYGWLVERRTQALDYRNLNPFKDDDINSLVKLNLGDWSFGTSKEAYANRVVGVAEGSRYQKLLTEFVQDDIASFKKADRNKLSDALIRGDKEGVDLDEMTLKSMGLSDKAIKAYYSVRTARNLLYSMRNDAAVTSLTRKGFSNIIHPKLVDDNGAFTFGREINIDKVGSRLILNVGEGTRVRMTDKLIDQINSGELKLIEMESTITVGGNKHSLVVVPTAETTVAPIKTVIPYRTGEMKRIYEDQYFIRMKGVEDVDGVPTEYSATHRTAKTKVEAERYIAAFNAVRDAQKAGRLTPEIAAKLQPYGWSVDDVMAEFGEGKYMGANLVSEFTRSDDDFLTKTTSVRSKFSNERGDRLKNIYGQEAEVANPFDSLAAEITNTSFMVPITEWRDATVYRWFNTVRGMLPLELRDVAPEKAFFEMQRARKEYVGNDKLKLFAQRVNDYVMHELSMVTKEEEKMQGLIRSFTEKLEGAAADGKFEGAASMTGAWLRQADPVGFARTVSFHSFLGGFNPVQLLVQGMNAVNAVAISPLHGLAATKNMGLIRMALMSDREDVWRNVARSSKLLGVDQDEFVLTVQSIRRSGLLDGINSTSLYGAETGKWSLTNGLTRKLGGASAFFFNRGEEASRIISFDIARREFIKANPEKVWWDDEALQAIMKRQDDLTQNMTTANLGFYQKGVLSIPTQFLQYNIKLAMNLVVGLSGNKRAFSQKEVLGLFVFHAALFGAAGFGVEDTPWLKEVFGEAYEGMDEQTRLVVQQGAVAGLINVMSEMFAGEGEGAEIAFGSRFQSLGTYTDWYNGIMNIFDTDAKDPDSPTVRDVLTGAAGSSIRRMINNTKSAYGLLIASDEIDLETAKEVAWLMGTGTFSSLNNIDKAMLARNNMNMVMSRNGTKLYSVNDVEQWFLAVGIPPASAADYDVLMRDKKKWTEYVKRVTNQAKQYQMLAAQARLDGDDVAVKNYQNAMAYIRQGLPLREQIAFDKAMVQTEPESKLRQLLIENLIKDVPNRVPTVNKEPGDVNG